MFIYFIWNIINATSLKDSIDDITIENNKRNDIFHSNS